MRSLLTAALVLATAALAAQPLAPDVFTVYNNGYVTDFYPGQCGEDLAAAAGRLTFCDGAGNLGVVTRNTGLAGRGVDRLLRNYADDRQVLRTRFGVSIRNPADGSFYNVPNEAFPAVTNGRYDSERRIGDALIAGDGRLVLTGNSVLQLGVLDFATGDLTRLSLADQHVPVLLAYDAPRTQTLVLARASTGVFLYVLPDGAEALTGPTALPAGPGNQLTAFGTATPLEYRNGRLLVGLNSGLYVYDLTNPTAPDLTHYRTEDASLPYDQVRGVAFGPGEGLAPKHDTVWLSIGDRNRSVLARLDLAAGQVIDTFRLNTGAPNNPDLPIKFGDLATDGDGLVSATTTNTADIVDLDISGGVPAWTRISQDSLAALGVPITYNPSTVDYVDGVFRYGTLDGSSSQNDNYELLLRAGDTWTGVTDDAPGNFSNLATSRFGEALPTPDGGLYWLNELDDALVYLDAAGEVRVFAGAEVRNLGREAATDGAGHLYHLAATGNGRLRVHDGLQSFPVAGAPNESLLLTSYGDEVWAYAPRAGVIEAYADRQVVVRAELPDQPQLSSYFHFAADANGGAWLAQSRTDIALVRYDVFTGVTTYDTIVAPGIGQLRHLLAAPDGSLWLVGRSGALNYADGEAGIVYKRDVDPFINSIDDAVVDTAGRLIMALNFTAGVAVLTPRGADTAAIETLQLDGTGGLLPSRDLYGSSVVTLDAAGDLWLEGGNGTGFLRVGGLGLAPRFRPGAGRPRLTGRVFLDANANGIYDEGEAAGAAGTTVAVKRADGGVFTTFIGPDGRYGYVLPTEPQPLEVILTRIPAYTGLASRRAVVSVPAETEDITGVDFALEGRDYRSVYLQTAEKMGAWGFDRAGFRNAFTAAVTNLAFRDKVFQNLEVEFAYVNGGADAPPLPDVDSVTVTRLTPAPDRYLHPYLLIEPKTHEWRLARDAPAATQTRVAADYDVDLGDDTVRVRLRLPRVNPRETFVFEVHTARFDPTGNGTGVRYGFTGTKSDGDDGSGSLADEQGYDGPWLLPPLDGGNGGAEDVSPGVDPNSPYIDPDDVYSEPPYLDPDDVYSSPPYETPIFSSYDPNDKLVAGGRAVCETGTEDVGCYNATSLDNRELTYTLRFENEGNFSAKDIFILDTLDAGLDARSLQVVEASHAVRVDFLDSAGQRAVVRFAFDDIFLPFQDSVNDGYVRFRLALAAAPTPGLEILNDAAIYFDQNPPIYTNTIANRFNDVSTGFAEAPPTDVTVELYPNPAVADVTVVTDGTLEEVRVYDARGAEVMRGGASAKLSIRGLAAGVYVVRVRTSEGAGTARLVRM